MRYVRFAILLLTAMVLQSSVVDTIALAGFNIKPDLLLILLVFFAGRAGPRQAIITSFLTGFAADVLGTAAGAQMLSFGLCGTLLGSLARYININKTAHQGIAIFVTGILTGLLTGLLSALKGQNISSLPVLAGVALYSAVLGPLLSGPLDWLMHLKSYRTGRLGA